MAKSRGTELLPDEDAVERQLRMLFWQGISEPITDKARYRKDNCNTFAKLITAARYGEEVPLFQSPKRVARTNQITKSEAVVQQTKQSQDNAKPAWVTEVCSLAGDVRELMKDRRLTTRSKESKSEGKSVASEVHITCYRCGQTGHIQVGCRNPPKPGYKLPGNDQGPCNQRS